MNEITLFEKDWGCLVFSFCLSRMEVLPRFALSAITGASVVNLSFLFFSLDFTIWSDEMREFNKKSRE